MGQRALSFERIISNKFVTVDALNERNQTTAISFGDRFVLNDTTALRMIGHDGSHEREQIVLHIDTDRLRPVRAGLTTQRGPPKAGPRSYRTDSRISGKERRTRRSSLTLLNLLNLFSMSHTNAPRKVGNAQS